MCETYNKINIEEMERQHPQYKPQKHWRKDQENIIMTTITIIIMIITTTMTMTEIVGLETGIDHIVEIDCKTTIKMITMMITDNYRDDHRKDYRDDCRKKIIGISKTRSTKESIEIIMKTHMKIGTTRIIIEIVTKTKIEIKTKANTEMTVMTKLEVGLKKRVLI